MTVRAPTIVAVLLVATALGVAAKPAPLPPIEDRLLTGFGRTVAIAGDVAFVGEPSQGQAGGGRRGGGGGGGGAQAAPATPPDPATVSGVVHVYRRLPTGWKETEKILAPDPKAQDGFGSVLTTDGTTLLISRFGAADNNTGSVYVYHKSAEGKWTAAGTLPATPPDGAGFGTASALSGGWAAIGAPSSGDAGGTVYLFHRSATGEWSASGTLTQAAGAATDRFGAAVAIDASRIAVGAPGRDLKGRVYVYAISKDGTTTLEATVTSRAVPDNTALGSAVVLKGDHLVIGGPQANFATVNATPVGRGGRAGAPPAAGAAAFDSNAAAANGRGGRQGGQGQPQFGGAPFVANPCAGGGGGRGGGGGGGGRGAAALVTPGVVVSFLRNATGTWQEKGVLTPFDVGNACFGSAIGIAGDEFWVGAPTSNTTGQIYRAKQEKDGTWMSMTKLTVTGVDGPAQLGAAFAVGTSAAVLGMPGDGSGTGAVTFLNRSPTTALWNVALTAAPPIIDPIPAVNNGKEAMCEGGMITVFRCENTSLYAYMPLSKIGGKPWISLSGMWGWTDPLTGHDIALIGRTDGTAFVDVTDPLHPKYLGDMVRTEGASISIWREIKTYKDFALVVSDGSGATHGIQIFDLKRLRAVKGAPQHFAPDLVYGAGSIHNVVVSEEAGFIYAVGQNGGGETCGGSMHMIDMHVPLKPKFIGCFADSVTGLRTRPGYVHDAQCVTYHGPDTRYTKHEICLESNETMISIQDMTDKAHIKILAHTAYPNVGYAHQGWFDSAQRYWYFDDEEDEGKQLGKAADGSRTMIWDMQDLENPTLVKEFIGPTKATDHNQFVKGNRLYQSNYNAGLRILDITDPINIREVGSLQTTTAVNITSQENGSWSNYPFFKNGSIGVVSMGAAGGFFIVKDRTNKVP